MKLVSCLAGLLVCVLFVVPTFTSAQWVNAKINGGHANVLGFGAGKSIIYCATDVGLYSKADSDIQWTYASAGGTTATSILVDGDTVTTYGIGIYRSFDKGNQWAQQLAQNFPNLIVKSVVRSGTSIFAIFGCYKSTSCSFSSGVYSSADGGVNWTATALLGSGINSLVVNNLKIYAGTNTGMMVSSNNGMTWESLGLSGKAITLIDASSTDLFAATGNEVYRSSDAGTVWTKVVAFPPYASPYGNIAIAVNTLLAYGKTIIAGVTSPGIYAKTYRSTDNGSTWSEITSGIQGFQISRFSLINQVLYAATSSHGVFTSLDAGATWMPNTIGVTTLNNTNCFARIGKRLFATSYGDGMLTSGDAGRTWVSIDKSIAYSRSIVAQDDHMLLGTNDGLFLSSDSCLNWKAVYNGTYINANSVCNALGVIGGKLFAWMNYGIYRSDDGGFTWSRLNMSQYFPNDYYTGMTVIAGRERLIVTGGYPGAYRSTDEGLTLTKLSNIVSPDYELDVRGLGFNGGYLFLGIWGRGIFRSSDDGNNWTTINTGLTIPYVQCIAMNGPDLFVGTNSGVFHSSNNGDQWEPINTGLSNTNISALYIDGNNLFAGTANGIFYRPLSEVTSIYPEKHSTPKEYGLAQNFPNPFNPSTTISFSLLSKSHVELKIYDVMGREVATLVTEDLSSGNYSRSWNASGMPSGVYFYRLRAGSFTETKRLILLR